MLIEMTNVLDYGNPDPDPEDIHRGPRFIAQPEDTVHEPVVTEAVASDIVTLQCVADAVPEPSMKSLKYFEAPLVPSVSDFG